MKKIILTFAGLLLLVGVVNIVSAGTQIIPDYGSSFEINNFQINPNLTITDVINLCIRESCIINEGEENNNLSSYSHRWKTVTIRSHYDSEVALILKYDSTTNAEGTKTYETLRLTTILPYEPNQACIDYAYEPSKGCKIISTHISPGDYNWNESVNTDLRYLKELNVIELSEEKIDAMSSLADADKSIHDFKGNWVQVGIDCVPTDIVQYKQMFGNKDNASNLHFSKEDESRGYFEDCPSYSVSVKDVSTIALPEEEYGNQDNVSGSLWQKIMNWFSNLFG